MKTTKENTPKHNPESQKNPKIQVNGEGIASPQSVSGHFKDLFGENVLFPSVEDASHLIVGTGHDDFMASRFAHAVEDAEASLVNLNLTSLHIPGNRHIVSLRVNHRSPERVARSLERYGYNIIDARGSDGVNDEQLVDRVNEFLHYLSV